MKKMRTFFAGLLLSLFATTNGQTQFTLDDAIRIASDSSLAAFKAQNLYLSSYWEYQTYMAQKKPTLSLNTTPFDYNRALNKVYNSELNINQYIEQQYIYSYANASITQPLTLTGGDFYFDTELSRLQNFGSDKYTQFSTVPFRIGFSQPVLGYNTFKWQKKIEPVKYEKAQKSYIQSVESISIQVVDYFFDLLVARSKVVMAGTNLANADTLFGIGQKRLGIASLSLADVLTLKVDVLNARNNLAEAKKQLKNAQFTFYSYLRLNEQTLFNLSIPDTLAEFQVNFEGALQQAQQDNPDILNYQQQLLESASDLEKTRRQSLWNASISASYGLNQQSPALFGAYQNPLDQQRATISLTVPIVDWGQRKGKINMAKRNFEVTKLTMEQAAIDFRQQIMIAVTNFNMQYDIVKSAHETQMVAKQAYEITKQRFLIGKADVNSLGLALNRQDQANLDYLGALRSYWKYYYTLRQLTLYDFKNKKTLSQNMDKILGGQ
jgi:hypothetical protein